MDDDFLRRVRVHLGEAMSIEAKQACRRSYDQESVSRLEDIIDNVRREAVFGRERVTEEAGCGLSRAGRNRGPSDCEQGKRA
jgi:hypothetical protein